MEWGYLMQYLDLLYELLKSGEAESVISASGEVDLLFKHPL